MSWANRWIGTPFKEGGRTARGADCWGLIRLVLAAEFNIAVPDFADQYAGRFDRRHLLSIINNNPELANWAPVPATDERPGDLLILRFAGYPIHFGIVVDDKFFLHTQKGLNAHLSEQRSSLWTARIVDVLRHKSRTMNEQGRE